MENIFKTASKLKLRFNTSKGSLSVEQLWDLNLTQLSDLIKATKKVLRKGEPDDDLAFLEKDVVVDVENTLMFEIAKEVYLSKKAENDAIRNAKEIKEHNQKILGLIAQKKEESLVGLSVEELEKMLK